MRLTRLLPVLLLLPMLAGCSYNAMPDWLVEMVGGPKRTGQYVDGPSKDSYVAERAKLKLPALTQDGAMRLQVAPSFGLYDYVLDFTPQPAGCLMMWRDLDFSDEEIKRRCRIIAVHVWRSATDNEGELIGLELRAFYVPEEDYRDAIQSFNDRLPSWRGRRFGMTDGTGLEFEQVRKGKIGSMTANANERGSDNPLSQLARDVHRLALAYGPADFFPRLYDWHSYSDPDYPCNGGLAGADPDGMGTGDDACAAWLKARPR
ncbi:hypothetical protein SAMN05518849_102331 [Sphingobium sp. AP50]|uniref:hypothetical protein n=1 Tax=Sphingobium sp. AP50 TaxID=1884369 RepID=UPI0008AE4BB7|nr:hypothetical protein [Sphingobium sp. AP50]SEJ05023.1 hypothetical protein SAMN05518849_102331 [Sphingobium sp. AP50]